MPNLRNATSDDIPALNELIARSARGLSAAHYRPEQVEGALRGAFGVDSQLLADGTYFVAEEAGRLVGCGGWSFRSTLFGGDARAGRDSSILDPKTQAAKIRAFFVDPAHARKMCAALQYASTGPGPILLRAENGVGHGARASSREIAVAADMLAFFAAHLRLPGAIEDGADE